MHGLSLSTLVIQRSWNHSSNPILKPQSQPSNPGPRSSIPSAVLVPSVSPSHSASNSMLLLMSPTTISLPVLYLPQPLSTPCLNAFYYVSSSHWSLFQLDRVRWQSHAIFSHVGLRFMHQKNKSPRCVVLSNNDRLYNCYANPIFLHQPKVSQLKYSPSFLSLNLF